MKHIALIDNYPITRAGISMVIKENLSETHCVHTADSIDHLGIISNTNDILSKICPDVIIMSKNEANAAVFEEKVAMAKLTYTKSKIIVFCESLDYTGMSHLISMGVSGFVLKNSELSQLIDCIKEIETREHFFCTELIGLIVSRFTIPGKSASPEKKHKLSSRETEIANYLIKGMRTSDIAERLDRKPTTVSTIKNNIFRKMKVDNIMALSDVMTKFHI